MLEPILQPQVVIKCAPLGFVAFGGPHAHVAFLRKRFVNELGWLSDDEFLELLAVNVLCILSGAISSQNLNCGDV